MTPIEILALIFAIAVLLKLIIVALSSKSWLGIVKPIYSNPVLLIVIELILSAVILYYLLQTLGIIQIMACVLLGALLTGLSFAAFSKEFLPFALKMLKGNIISKAWLPILIWLALSIWVLIELFA